MKLGAHTVTFTDEREAKKWLFRENIRLEQLKKELEESWAQLEQQKRDFRLEQDMTEDRNRLEKRKLENEKRLFEMKWKVLEDELVRFAEDKKKMEAERAQYHASQPPQPPAGSQLSYGVFFIGVHNKQALKKRYRDLIKIFHPDNAAGDKTALQEINREYALLKKRL